MGFRAQGFTVLLGFLKGLGFLLAFGFSATG